MRLRRRRWPVTMLIVGAVALTLGSCAGAMIGRYTVTGMVPLAPIRPAVAPRDSERDPLFDSPYGAGEAAD